MRALWLGNQPWFIVSVNELLYKLEEFMEISPVFWIII